MMVTIVMEQMVDRYVYVVFYFTLYICAYLPNPLHYFCP